MPAKELLGQKAFDFNRAAQLAILERAVITTRGPGKAVLKALDSYQRENPSSFPSHETLAHNIGCSTRTVRRATHELAALGLITIQQGYRPDGSKTSNHYSIVWSKVLDLVPSQSVASAPATVASAPVTVSGPSLSVHLSDQIKTMDHGDDGVLNSLDSEGRREWWGRRKPLAKAELLCLDVILQLWHYARRREWLGPGEREQLLFFALCHYCATSCKVNSPGALLTARMTLRLPPEREAERFRGICLADEDQASRWQLELRRRQPVNPETRPPVLAVAAAIGIPTEARRSREEQMRILRERET